MFNKLKCLKEIPCDVVTYVVIEGEAICDDNDKMMIVSYAQEKMKTIDWYLALIAADSEQYIVPQSKSHLEGLKSDLQAAIKKIMATPIPSPKNNDFVYPKGYEG